MAKKKQFVVHEYTERALRVLGSVPQGHTILYSEITSALGLDAQTEGRHYVDSARRILLRERDMVFDPIIGEGLKRLTNKEIASRGKFSLRRINRMAKRESRKADCLDSASPDLTNEDKLKHAAHSVMLGFLITKSSHIERETVEKNMNRTGIPPQQDLRSFMGS